MDGFRKNTDSDLRAALGALAEADQALDSSSAVRARLLEEVRAIRRGYRRSVAKAFAIAAGLVAVLSVPIWQLAQLSDVRPASSSGAAVKTADARTNTGEPSSALNENGFLPLIYSSVPMADGLIVRLEVSRRELESLGVTSATGDELPERVLADVVVGSDGLARALRFVPPPLGGPMQESQP
jgi:hypothetical protein